MSKVIVTYDTVDKSLVVKMDGNVLDNVDSASFSKKMMMEGDMQDAQDMADEYYMNICICEDSQDNGTMTRQYISANKDGEISKASQLMQDIRSYYGK